MKIVINRSHVDNTIPAQYNYTNNDSCPLACTMKEVLNREDIRVSLYTIYKASGGAAIGTINPPFYFSNYEALRLGKIDEFETEYTPINN